MGNPMHPNVIFLQAFRDDWLWHRRWGPSTIKIYYKFGPAAALFIAKSKYLRVLSSFIIVNPMVWIAKRLYKP
jgi:hypothetical protein